MNDIDLSLSQHKPSQDLQIASDKAYLPQSLNMNEDTPTLDNIPNSAAVDGGMVAEKR